MIRPRYSIGTFAALLVAAMDEAIPYTSPQRSTPLPAAGDRRPATGPSSEEQGATQNPNKLIEGAT